MQFYLHCFLLNLQIHVHYSCTVIVSQSQYCVANVHFYSSLLTHFFGKAVFSAEFFFLLPNFCIYGLFWLSRISVTIFNQPVTIFFYICLKESNCIIVITYSVTLYYYHSVYSKTMYYFHYVYSKTMYC